MGDVLKPPTRAQLAAFLETDQQALLAFDQLFKVSGFQPGDVFYSGARVPATRALPADGSAVSRTLYPALFSALVPVSAVTITVASPGVVTWTAHGLAANSPVYFTTNGALPTGLVAGTEYFVKTVPGVDTFTVSATAGGAVINTSGTQSGTHMGTAYPFGIGDATTTFNVPTVAALPNALPSASPVAVTIASPGVVFWTGHGLPANTPVYFATSGALPTGIVVGTEYFVKTVLSTDTFTISTTAGGTVINTSGAQSGTHAATAYPTGPVNAYVLF